MTTQFRDTEHCLEVISQRMHEPLSRIKERWEQRQQIPISFPQYDLGQRFTVDEFTFAISDFREGKCIWTVFDDGFMRRW